MSEHANTRYVDIQEIANGTRLLRVVSDVMIAFIFDGLWNDVGKNDAE